MSTSISRRDALKLGGIVAAGSAAAAMIGCSPSNGQSAPASGDTANVGVNSIAGHTREGIPSFLQAPEPITDITETRDYDVVIVGAGAAGVPAAITAKEAGASVALIQKEPTAISQGNTCTGILTDSSDPAGVAYVVSKLLSEHQLRAKREQVELWAKNSGEAITWLFDLATELGCQVSDTTMKWCSNRMDVNGYHVNYLSLDFGPKPYNTGHGMRTLCEYAESIGVEVFDNTGAKQLVGDAAGVTGVIAEGETGTIQFNAAKGVILATGDYQNDDEMVNYYLPDLKNLGRKQSNKTGDGHKMAVWAGGQIENISHTKMLHDFDAGPGAMADMPFLAVKMNGTRYCDESAVGMSLMNCFLGSEEDAGNYCQIFDGAYMTKSAEWPGKLYDEEMMKAYMPEEPGEKTGVYEDQINTFKADTLEELAGKLGITDTAAFVKTVERYNELVAKGADEDFGKAANWLTSIDTPPFYGIHRKVRVSALVSGVNVGPNMEVLAAGTNEPIPGLFAIGNCAGNFYSGIDYTMWMPGLSLGRAHTQGYVTGKYVASL